MNKKKEFYSLLYTLYTTGCDIWLLKTNKKKDNFYQNEEDSNKNEKEKWVDE